MAIAKPAETLEEGINNLIDASIEDYRTFYDRDIDEAYANERIAAFADSFEVSEGRSYAKVIREGSVHCFIVLKPANGDDHLKVGDVLKPAGWSAPARNRARGNVLEGNYPINWTGPYYLK